MEETKKQSFETQTYSDFVEDVDFFLGIKAFLASLNKDPKSEFICKNLDKDIEDSKDRIANTDNDTSKEIQVYESGRVRDYTLLGILKEIYRRRHADDEYDEDIEFLECIEFDQESFYNLGYDLAEFEDKYFEIAYFLLHSRIFREKEYFATPDNLVYLLLSAFKPDKSKWIFNPNCGLGEFAIPLRGYDVACDTSETQDEYIGFVKILRDAASTYFWDCFEGDFQAHLEEDIFQQIIYVSSLLMHDKEDDTFNILYDHLADDGRMALVVRTSWLTKPFENKEFQKTGIGRMYADNVITHIIQLPQNAVPQTSASVSIVIVDKSKRTFERNPYSFQEIKMTDLTGNNDASDYFSFSNDVTIDEYRSTIDSWMHSETYSSEWRFYDKIEADYSNSNTIDVELKYIEEHQGILVPSLYRVPYYYSPVNLVYAKEPIEHPASVAQVDVVTTDLLSRVFPATPIAFNPEDKAHSTQEGALWYQGPAVLLRRENGKIYTGYVSDDCIFECPEEIHVLGAKRGNYHALAGLLLENEVEDQMRKIDAGEECFGRYPEHFRALRFDDQLNLSNYVSLKMSDLLKEAHLELDAAYTEYQKEIHRRKHAMSQIVSALSANMNCLVSYVEHNMDTSQKISQRRDTTVQDILRTVVRNMKVLERQTVNLAEVEYDWGQPVEIDPQEFLTDYVRQNKSTRYEYIFDNTRLNKRVATDGTVGKEASFMCPTAALTQIMSNIIANAEAHGFTDLSHEDYKIRLSWTHENGQVVIHVANNGTPMNAELEPEEALKYGVSTAFNSEGGHSGIGCYDIKNIIEKQGGSVSILKLTDQEYTVEYVLEFPKKNEQI